jgi:hypothetical protein
VKKRLELGACELRNEKISRQVYSGGMAKDPAELLREALALPAEVRAALIV